MQGSVCTLKNQALALLNDRAQHVLTPCAFRKMCETYIADETIVLIEHIECVEIRFTVTCFAEADNVDSGNNHRT
jgi:hypothetical protein